MARINFLSTAAGLASTVVAGIHHLLHRQIDPVDGTRAITWLKRTMKNESLAKLALGHVRVIESRRELRLPNNYAHLFAINRYLIPYLANGLSVPQKRSVVLHNQSYSLNLLGHRGIELLCENFELWSAAGCTIDWQIDHLPSNEGEFALVFSFDGERLQWLRFTFADAKTFGFAAEPAIVVGAIQGKLHAAEATHRAAVTCNGVRSAYLLLSAVNAIADFAGVKSIIGISNIRLVNQEGRKAGRMLFDYDGFWTERGAVAGDQGFYSLSRTAETAVPGASTASHRRRAVRRREFREATRAQALGRCRVLVDAAVLD